MNLKVDKTVFHHFKSNVPLKKGLEPKAVILLLNSM